MKKEKLWNRLTVVLIVLALLLTSVLAYHPDLFGLENASTLYASTVFDKMDIMDVNIIMDEDDWNTMLENAMSEEYYSCDVEINGTKYCNIGIRPKGNTSLTTIVSDDTTDRYSFKLEFDHYVKGKSLDGLDKLALNNVMSDTTYMKEYIAYDILTYLGVNTSLYSYATIHVNGEYWGLYFAVEAVEDSFLQRNYCSTDAELYKPETIGGGGEGGPGEMPEGMDGNMEDMREMFENMSDEEKEALKEQFEGGGFQGGRGMGEARQQSAKPNQSNTDGNTDVTTNAETTTATNEGSETVNNKEENAENMTETQKTTESAEANNVTETQASTNQDPTQQANQNESHRGGMGGGMMGSDLAYIDDEYDSYSVIWESSILGDVSDSDKDRVIEALKNISAKENVEDYLDVDQMLRYIAANVVILNDDSYFGTMLHNYYLYEKDGKLCMIPWDYNLAFGGFAMGSSDATNLVNRAIDDVVSSGTLEERPLLAAALSTEDYMEQYHAYLQELMDGYFNSGQFMNTVEYIKEMISLYVESDPTAFYTYEEFEAGVETLIDFVNARVESIQAQLDGEIPSANAERTGEGYTLVDGSDINVSTMGTQGGGDKDGHDMGGFGDQGGQGFPGAETNTTTSNGTTNATDATNSAGATTADGSTDTNVTADANNGNQMQMPSQGADGSIDGSQMQAPPQGEMGSADGGQMQTPPQGADGNTNGGQMQTPPQGADGNTDGNQMQASPQGGMGMMPGSQAQSQSGTSKTEAMIFTGASIVLIFAALLFVKFYRRRKY